MPPKIISSEPLLEENLGLLNLTSAETGYNTASHAGLQSDLSLRTKFANKHVIGARGRLEGHTNSVHTIAFSPDGKLVASGSHDGTVQLWDSATGEPRGTLEGHTNSVLTIAFSPDGKLVASGSSSSFFFFFI